MIPDPLATYPSLEAFYDANDARRRSLEIDFGVHWREVNRPFPTWRLSYVDLTGEVYAIQMAGVDRVEVIGRFPLRPCTACSGTGGESTSCPECGGSSYSRLAVEAALARWADICGDDGSLDWARERCAAISIGVAAR